MSVLGVVLLILAFIVISYISIGFGVALQVLVSEKGQITPESLFASICITFMWPAVIASQVFGN